MLIQPWVIGADISLDSVQPQIHLLLALHPLTPHRHPVPPLTLPACPLTQHNRTYSICLTSTQYESLYPSETPHHPTCPTPTTDLNPAPVPPEFGPSRRPAQPPRPTLLAMDRDQARPTSPTPDLVRLGEDITDPIALIPIITVPLSVHLNSPARNPRRRPDMILEVIFSPITLPTTKRVHLVTIARSRR